MQRLNMKTYSEYYFQLKKDQDEVKIFIESFSINVTHFFRDKSFYDFFYKDVIKNIYSHTNGAGR